jgi:hypothetical protein
MKKLFFYCLVLAMAQADLARVRLGAASRWEQSVVTLEVTRKQFDYLQPWIKRMENYQKHGIVIGQGQIITTAEYLNDLVMVRLQKGGRGKWWQGQLKWIDYHANLALVTTTDPAFWSNLDLVALADPVPTQGSVQLVRWRNGNLEMRKGEINRLAVKRGKLSFVDLMLLEIDSEINSAGWAEVIAAGREVIGLTCSQDGNTCTGIPAPFIRSVAEARQGDSQRRLGYFDFIWQKAENPATLNYLKLTGEPRGVIVIDFAVPNGAGRFLKRWDIIMQIDRFPLDTEGDYVDPAYGNLSLENLANRYRWAGDEVRMQVWREGKLHELKFPLSEANFAAELVPESVFDQDPEYLLVGGLVFQPLDEPYLRSWGSDWRRKAPFRLAYYAQEKPTPERPARVVLSVVLPDPYNLGYQDYRFMVCDQVNGLKISRLADLTAALQKPIDGFHVVEFAPGESVRRLVLDADAAEAATRRVMQRYGIEKDRFFAAPPSTMQR